MIGKKYVWSLLLGMFILAVISYLISPTSIYSEIIYLLASFSALVAAFFALSAYGLKNTRGKGIAFISTGICCWFLGELLWFILSYIMLIDPYPSVADFFYVIAYPMFFIGILMILWKARIDWNDRRITYFLFAVAIISTMSIYFGGYLAYDPSAGLLENLFGILYNIGDAVLILGSLLILFLAMDLKGGKLFSSWLAFTGGIFLIFVADILFSIYYAPYEENVFLYLQMDHLWIGGYLLVAVCLFRIYYVLKDAEGRISDVEKRKTKS